VVTARGVWTLYAVQMELASLVQLAASHRRHDEVMQALLAAARRLAAGRPDDGDLAAIGDAVGYFEHSVRRHFLDEEGSVFPRLSTRRPQVAEALAALSAEHPPQIKLQGEVAAIARELDRDARPTLGKQLLDAAEQLAELHGRHVKREDALFATAHEVLTAEDDAEIAAEMEMRRDRDDVNGDKRVRGAAKTARKRPAAKPAGGRKAQASASAKKKPAAAAAKKKPAARTRATDKPKRARG
jgi:hemerythrin-like domain-containing protein